MSTDKSKSHIEYIVAATAVLISIMTLAVYIYQARIMSAQQRVSVWPYVEWDTSNVDGFRIGVHNRGVGPAIVRNVELRVNGKSANSGQAIVRELLGPESKVSVINSYLLNRVLAPGESVDFLQIKNSDEGHIFDQKFNQADFKFEITYCSIYGECWTTEGTKARRVQNMDQDIY